MNASTVFNTWQQWQRTTATQCRQWWQQRAPREQRLLTLTLVVFSAALVWLLGVRPALNAVRQAHTRLPVLHAQAAEVQALLLEAQALQRGQRGRVARDAIENALQLSLRRAGLDAVATVQVQEDGWEITLQDVSAAQVMAWLSPLPQQLQVRVQSVDLARTQRDGRERPGNISGRVVVAYPPEAA